MQPSVMLPTLGWRDVLLRPFAPVAFDAFRCWVEIARVLAGLVFFHQALNTYGCAGILGAEAESMRTLALCSATLSALVAIGLFAPLALGALIIVLLSPFPSMSLGTSVALILVWTLLLAGAGRRFSADALLSRTAMGRLITPCYLLALADTPRGAAHVRRFTLVVYWGLCLNAMAWHAEDGFWWSGKVLQVVYSTPYLTDFYQFTESWHAAWPEGYRLFCGAALGVQAFWEVMLVPLMLWRRTRPFAALQGWFFFTLCLFSVGLSYLPAFEIVLWFLVFSPSETRALVASAIGKAPSTASLDASPANDRRWPQVGAIVATIGCLGLIANLFLTNAIFLHLTGRERGSWEGAEGAVRKGLFVFGYADVCVFNEADLDMGGLVVVFSEVDADGKLLRVVPVADYYGGRLAYVRNDLTYFRVSLAFQRSHRAAGFEPNPAHARQCTEPYVRRFVEFDAVLTGPANTRHYRADLFTRQRDDSGAASYWTEPKHLLTMRVCLSPDEVKAARDRHHPAFRLPPGHLFEETRTAQTEEQLRKLFAAEMQASESSH